MARLTSSQLSAKTGMVKKIVKHHFGETPKRVVYQPAGLTNFVFDVKTSSGNFIVRVADIPEKINDYLKEQWAVIHAREKGVPVAEILEVGNDIIGKPYMLQERLEGTIASHHPERLNIVHTLGEYAATIHTISTNNFGSVFDWSENQLSKNNSWKEFLENEFEVESRLEILQRNKMLSPGNFSKLKSNLARIEKWKKSPTLNHGDLRLKNVIVNDKAKIIAIIDWEDCTSNMAPYWDLAVALHDLSIDAKQQFLEGYGMPPKQYSKMSFALKTINILYYTDEIQLMIERKQKDLLEQYRLRLNGHYDLFAL